VVYLSGGFAVQIAPAVFEKEGGALLPAKLQSANCPLLFSRGRLGWGALEPGVHA